MPFPARDDAFDLVRRHVLSFVDDEIRLFQGAAADEIEGFRLDELAIEDFLNFFGQFPFVLVAFVFITVDKLFQVVDDGPHDGRNLFLFVAGQEADVRVKLRIRPADENPPVFAGRMVDDFFQAHSQGIERLCCPGWPLMMTNGASEVGCMRTSCMKYWPALRGLIP